VRDSPSLVDSDRENNLPGGSHALHVVGIDWHDFLQQKGIRYALTDEKVGAANLLLCADCG